MTVKQEIMTVKQLIDTTPDPEQGWHWANSRWDIILGSKGYLKLKEEWATIEDEIASTIAAPVCLVELLEDFEKIQQTCDDAFKAYVFALEVSNSFLQAVKLFAPGLQSTHVSMIDG